MANFSEIGEPATDVCSTNALTVDVEDYFQVSAFEQHVRRTEWANFECRLLANTDRILELFDEADAKATFFFLGWVAENFPQLLRKVADQGHEIASHGYSHIRVTNQNAAEFREDVIRTKKLLEDVSGKAVIGYRAASYSINASNLWAHPILAETGHLYSSSIYPIRHDLYGLREAPRFAFRIDGGDLIELPVTTFEMAGFRFPCGGGGYFRLLPYRVSHWAMSRVNERDKRPAIFYFHPWEIDPDQPRLEGLRFKTKFRHYINLARVERRLKRLLQDFNWDRMDRVFEISA